MGTLWQPWTSHRRLENLAWDTNSSLLQCPSTHNPPPHVEQAYVYLLLVYVSGPIGCTIGLSQVPKNVLLRCDCGREIYI